MYNRPDQPWYEAIPYGPLTEDIYSRLAISFYLPGREAMREIARQRGIKEREYDKYERLKWRQTREYRAKSIKEGQSIEEHMNE